MSPFFICTESHNEHPKVAQLAKKSPNMATVVKVKLLRFL